jgi:hypothetical protein
VVLLIVKYKLPDMKQRIIWVFMVFLMATCQGGRNDGKSQVDDFGSVYPPDMHTSQISLDYHGVYVGVLPCADCEGIHTEVRLYDDDTYLVISRYMGKDDLSTHENEGVFSWNEAGNTITLEGLEPPNQFFVGENHLIRLDRQGQRITGDLADDYILEKKQDL